MPMPAMLVWVAPSGVGVVAVVRFLLNFVGGSELNGGLDVCIVPCVGWPGLCDHLVHRSGGCTFVHARLQCAGQSNRMSSVALAWRRAPTSRGTERSEARGGGHGSGGGNEEQKHCGAVGVWWQGHGQGQGLHTQLNAPSQPARRRGPRRRRCSMRRRRRPPRPAAAAAAAARGRSSPLTWWALPPAAARRCR